MNKKVTDEDFSGDKTIRMQTFLQDKVGRSAVFYDYDSCFFVSCFS